MSCGGSASAWWPASLLALFAALWSIGQVEPVPARRQVAQAGDRGRLHEGPGRHAEVGDPRPVRRHLQLPGLHEPVAARRQHHGQPTGAPLHRASRPRARGGPAGRQPRDAGLPPAAGERRREAQQRHPEVARPVPAERPGQPDGPRRGRLRRGADRRGRPAARQRRRRRHEGLPPRPRLRPVDPALRAGPPPATGAGQGCRHRPGDQRQGRAADLLPRLRRLEHGRPGPGPRPSGLDPGSQERASRRPGPARAPDGDRQHPQGAGASPAAGGPRRRADHPDRAVPGLQGLVPAAIAGQQAADVGHRHRARDHRGAHAAGLRPRVGDHRHPRDPRGAAGRSPCRRTPYARASLAARGSSPTRSRS